jgi:phospholipase/carboxylesterase
VLEYCIEVQTRATPQCAVIWLHGLGADGYDFVPVVKELEALGAPPARYVFPHAPMIPVTINNGFVMRAWYDIRTGDLAQREDEAGIRASQAQVEQLIEREVQRGMPRSASCWPASRRAARSRCRPGCGRPNRWPDWWRCPATCRWRKVRGRAGAGSAQVPILLAHGTRSGGAPGARHRRSRTTAAARLRRRLARVSDAALVCGEEIEDIAPSFAAAGRPQPACRKAADIRPDNRRQNSLYSIPCARLFA